MQADMIETGSRHDLTRQLAGFFLLVFLVTWGIAAFVLFLPETSRRVFGEFGRSSVLFYVAVYAPLISSLACTARRHGRSGIAELLRRYVVRANWRWWAVAVSMLPLTWLVLGALESLLGLAPRLAHEKWWSALPLVLASGQLISDPGPIGEELGWRGYALPRLLALMSPLSAGLLLGAIWSVWHLPAFFVAPLGQSLAGVFWFMSTGVAVSVLMTFVYVNANGNVTAAGVLPHLMLNACLAVGIAAIGPATTLALWAVVALLLALCGQSLRWSSPSASAVAI
jgi:membrane protease YdiL (CAAX protease family)